MGHIIGIPEDVNPEFGDTGRKSMFVMNTWVVFGAVGGITPHGGTEPGEEAGVGR